MPIAERTPPHTGAVTGRAVAKDELRTLRRTSTLRVGLPALISASIVLSFICRVLANKSRRGLLKRLLVTPEPSIPAVLLRENPAPDEALHGFSKVLPVAQDRVESPNSSISSAGWPSANTFRSR